MPNQYLKGHPVRYVDEFQRDKLVAFVEDSGVAVVIDRNPIVLKSEDEIAKAGSVVDFNINKYEKITMFGIFKIPRLAHHYFIKYQKGIKIVDAL